ncbi:glycosyltransferase family 2 protein [uncultured Muribaculum sp.]|uniref:glycosyltransferase family 2 protein n=1 Tax=uncultured Muribaculum sp. TaxID=1918613 RepID=UPI0025B76BE9|nr:glycosyltransferase family 2 protein [uncultured Muribaculum sp.]
MLTVSIVTYHTCPEELSRCIQSLDRNIVRHIYVIDNSTQKYIAELCHKFNVEYIANNNTGYGAAHNIAIKKAFATKARYHLVLNSDVEFDSRILKKIMAYMDNNPDVGQLQPKIVCPDNSLQYTCRLLPTPFDLALRRFTPNFFLRKRKKRYILAQADWNKSFDVAYQQGSFLFFRIYALKNVGLFDERYFMYPEDIDISRRMALAWKVRYWPGATVVHNHRAASYHSVRMLLVHLKNMALYFNKWGWLHDNERKRLNNMVTNQFKNVSIE